MYVIIPRMQLVLLIEMSHYMRLCEKVLSVLVSFTLASSLIGVPAYADETGQGVTTSEEATAGESADTSVDGNSHFPPAESDSYSEGVDSKGLSKEDANDGLESGVFSETASDEAKQTGAAIVPDDKESVSFLYIARTEIISTDSQEIAFALSDESLVVGSATLLLRDATSGEVFTILSDKTSGNAASFLVGPGLLPLGTIMVESVSYFAGG